MPYLCTSPERKSTSKAPKRVPRVRAMGSIAGFRVPVLYHRLLRVGAIMCQPTLVSPATSPNSKSCTVRPRTGVDQTPAIAPQVLSRQFRHTRTNPQSKKRPREEHMPSTRMVTTVLLGVVQKIRKSTGFNPGLL